MDQHIESPLRFGDLPVGGDFLFNQIGLGLGVWGLEFEVWALSLGRGGLGFGGVGVWGLGFEFGVWGLGFGVWDWGLGGWDWRAGVSEWGCRD